MLVSVLDKITQDYEVLYVNDGSTDQSSNVLQELLHHVRVIKFRITGLHDSSYKLTYTTLIVGYEDLRKKRYRMLRS